MSEHARFADDVGAYLLLALDEREQREFESHLATCPDCREELELLRPAAEALPASVEQLAPPAGLKRALMAELEGDAEAGRAPPAPRRRRAWAPPRLLRPAFVAAALVVGLAVGFAVAQLGGDETRTVAATVDEAMPRAGGTLLVSDDGAMLRLHDMPDLGQRQVYQVWLQHGDEMVPARTFEIGAGGGGAIELPDVHDADGVYVTREARGGARVPSEAPIVSVPL